MNVKYKVSYITRCCAIHHPIVVLDQVIYNEKIQNHLLTHGMNETNQTKHMNGNKAYIATGDEGGNTNTKWWME